MRKLVLLSFVIVASLQFCGAQSLDKMQWFNEPEQWEIKDKSLSMQVTPTEPGPVWQLTLKDNGFCRI